MIFVVLGLVLTSPSSSRAIEILIPLGVESVYKVMFGDLDMFVDVSALFAKCPADCFSLVIADAIQCEVVN